jgi:AcrR family transcriptional regulator
VGRRPRPEIRQRLLAACTDHILAHGIPSGLAPLARAAGTSPRMLIYHFGTRDRLLREVLSVARDRQVALFRAALAARDEPYPDTIARAWRLMTGPEGAPFLRLFGTLHAAPPGRSLWPDFRRAATTDWLPMLEDGLRADNRAPALASTVLAVVRGLLLDRDATGDTARTDEAFTAFIGLLKAA